MKNFIALSLPKFTFFSLFIKKPILLIFMVVPTVAVSPVVDFKSAAWILFWLFIVDLLSGLYGSFCEWRKKKNKIDKWFFGRGEGFSSDKFKKMGIKAMVYMGCPYFMVKFQNTFMLKNLKYESLSDAEITIPTFFILLFILNEGFSIVHENLPKCGFNVYSRINKIAGVYKSTKKKFTDD